MMHTREKDDPTTEPLKERVYNGRTGKCVGGRTLFNGKFVGNDTQQGIHHDTMGALAVILNELRDLRAIVDEMRSK